MWTGLQGCKRPIYKDMYANTFSKVLSGLRKVRLVWTASDNGSITIWRDDKGLYHASYSRLMCEREHSVFTSKEAIRKWFKEWLPKTH